MNTFESDPGGYRAFEARSVTDSKENSWGGWPCVGTQYMLDSTNNEMMMKEDKIRYRPLTAREIETLRDAECEADDWSHVQVSDGFCAEAIRRACFMGEVRIGRTGTHMEVAAGVTVRSGIVRATLCDCVVGDDVRIADVGRRIVRYRIGDRTLIEDVGEVRCGAMATFGCGVEAAVVNEGGGREVVLFEGLTAQIAYLEAMYRHRPQTIEQLRRLSCPNTEGPRDVYATIGREVRLCGVRSVVDVQIGDGATVDGALALRNGTIGSTLESPSRIGVGVTATDFVTACSSTVDTGAMLKRCFVGEGVVIENGFSAENSLFFANSHCAHGEACSLMAGPFTVTHHRSTLLIAGYTLFFNAGSGANQSNHMYRSGPVHQGIHLRGCKFGSDAYILLPAATGAFTIVKGRHYNHYDTRRMPFSFLIEQGGESELLPALGLRSYGTARDGRKWLQRDRRKGVAHDRVTCELMTPYMGDALWQGLESCRELLARHPLSESVAWQGVRITTHSLKRGAMLYEQALYAYLGALLDDDTQHQPISGEWIDWGGWVVPRERVEALLDRLERGAIGDLEAWNQALDEIERQLTNDRRGWAEWAAMRLVHATTEGLTPDQRRAIREEGARARRTFMQEVARDAGRDYAASMSVGYGIDSVDVRAADFEAVRGELPDQAAPWRP